MSHHHHHPPARSANWRRMWIALVINGLLLAAGIAGGIAFGSLALLADAGHVLSDAGAIALGLAAAWMARRPAVGRRTFGLHRTEILAAVANGLLLVGVAAVVIVAAIDRLGQPPSVKGLGVVAIGLVALAGNAAATLVLLSGDRGDLNLEGVLRHSAADALGALGVVVSGLVVLTTGWRYADPIASIAIGLLIIWGSLSLLRDAVNVLLEAAPVGVDVRQVGRAMVAVPGVREVHDLHVWTVTSGFPALAAHVRSDPSADVDEVRRAVEALLAERFEIRHTTLQMMVERLLEIEDRRGNRPPLASR